MKGLPPRVASQGIDPGHVAVLAHGLLNKLSATGAYVGAARSMLDTSDDGVRPVDEMLIEAQRLATVVVESLRDLIVQLPATWTEHP